VVYDLKPAAELQKFLSKIQKRAGELIAWQQKRLNLALVNLEKVFLDIHKDGQANAKQCRDATREFVRINLYHPDFYFILTGMALLVFVTRSFSDSNIDYGPWRPLVVSLAAMFAGSLPVLVSVLLYPLHVAKRVNIWVLTVANVFISANLFALIEPIIPNFFYTDGVLHYQDLIYGILVFYLIALLYLQLRLNKHVCLNCYWDRQSTQNINNLIPADKRGDVLALAAQDHYVEISTENGQHLHRMSMTEAVALLPADTGLQVHRSHWVAFDAMLSLKKTSDKYHLELRNGTQIPVSRNKIAAVKKHLSHD
jgi:hypothetical protein